MSDLFHKAVPVDFILKTFDVMRRADWHHFQVLTKRSDRLLELSPKLPWKPHIWMGVSIETLDYTFRIDHLRQTGAVVKYDPGARPMDPAWALEIRDQCLEARVPFFFKQWGATRKKKAGRELDGRTWDEMPALALVADTA
jgi:protein gp37